MSDYLVIAVEGEVEKRGTSNLFDAVDLIKRFQKAGKTVYVAHGVLSDGDEFIKRVKRLYR